MNKLFKITACLLLVGTAACSRVETGTVAVVRNFDKTIEMQEALPGNTVWTVFSDAIDVQTKDIEVDVTDMRPLAADNSTVQDFDLSVIYSINPQMAADLYVDKSGGFHSMAADGDLLLMYNFIHQVARNAAYKAARQYKSLELSDNRPSMEAFIVEQMNQALNEEKGLEGAITVSQVLIRNIQPATAIVDSANEFIRSQNELKKKQVELETARVEADRIKALSQNQDAIEYMNAQSLQMIAEGVRDGKVSAIVVPHDFKGIVNVK